MIRKITPGGVVSTVAGNGSFVRTDGAANSASFTNPTGITIDASGNIYVADAGYSIIRKITPAGLVSTIAGNAMNGLINATGILASFSTPVGIASDGQGNLFIADRGNELIRKLSITGYTISPALPAGLTFDTTTGNISGTPTVITPATNYTITAYNVSGGSTAIVNLAVVLSKDATLSALVLGNGTLTPAFAAGTTSYTASVNNTI